MKSLWAMDNPSKVVPHIHDVSIFFDELRAETIEALRKLDMTRELVGRWPTPFTSNRYSMERSDREIVVYPTRFLRPLVQLLRDRLEEARTALFDPARHPAGRPLNDGLRRAVFGP